MRYREEWGKGYDFLFGAAAWRGKNKSNLVNINLIHCFHSVFFFKFSFYLITSINKYLLAKICPVLLNS